MNRISALNGDSDSGSSDDDETHVTQEAQETIAFSEYMRALQLKAAGNLQMAESLLGELLETKVLNEATKDAKDNKMFHVKYSCFKNLGLICAEREDNDMAIDYLLDAIELDDTDITLMHRLGKLALSMDHTLIAQMAFRKCLKQNPNHWPSADGMLRVLCLREDYAEAYGWALTWYEKSPTYQFGLDVILEIREKLDGFGLDYVEQLWKMKFTDTHLKRTNLETVFPKYIIPDPEPIEAPDLTGLYLNESNLSWLSVGQLIVDMYEKFQDTSQIGYDMTLDEWLGRDQKTASNRSSKTEVHQPMDCDEPSPTIDPTNIKSVVEQQLSDESLSKENSSSNTEIPIMFVIPPGIASAAVAAAADPNTSADISGTEESDGGAAAVASKPKASRRRGGGDLIGLEQWGWHKNKRYSQRKKSLDRTDPDSTINGMLRKALGTFFDEKFDASESPFDSIYFYTSTAAPANRAEPVSSTAVSDPPVTLSAFLLATQEDFVAFMTELKDRPYFDMMVLVIKWCQYIARYWSQPVPSELQAIFMKLYVYHLNHWNIMSWNQLERTEFQSVFRMTLFYLELSHNGAMLKARDGFQNELDPQWRMLFNHLMFFTGFYEPDEHTQAEYDQFQIRWNWLMYLQARFENNLDLAVDYLYSTEQLIQAIDTPISLPNLSAQHNRITVPIIDALKIHLEHFIRLFTVPQLYHDKKYDQIVPILTDSLHLIDWKEDPIAQAAESATISPITRMEILLECYWQMDSFDECLMWSESSLAYSLGHFLKAPPDTHRQTRWGKSVTFILSFLVGMFENEPISIVEQMGRYGCRLVQNIARIVVHQLDGPFDKNYNPLHAIDLKMPWVLLHSLIQRVENVQYGRLRRAAYTDATIKYKCAEDGAVPMSIMMFFQVHDFLGNRSWCTQKDGQMLLYVMDVVADRLRISAALDRHRDTLAEYLEQVTYCLYGYPAKRARARHIEEHDACNVELTWPRAMQLFNLYRPETLPEFNSYKNDSISADMEQLLQRIVALIPAENDPSPLTGPIQDFINGTSLELPENVAQIPSEILPKCMQCIHYLLADHYFKNRDLVKSVKYYILDLTLCPGRFDAWAGLALSKASVLETKLNACTALATNEFLSQCEESLRCFQQCFRLDDEQVPLWIEYGNFAYTMHSFCSRSLKQASETLSMERFEFMENKKEQCLKTAADCFNTVNAHTDSQNHPNTLTNGINASSSLPITSSKLTNGNASSADDSHDEKWLYHYMLGKVAEKRKEQPDAIIAHYIESAKCLYEHNASYPFKISHSAPQHLSVEALEVYYRITASIVKYLEQHATVSRAVGRLFIRVLREVNASPFALNQAKIDGNSINALKRKTPTIVPAMDADSNPASPKPGGVPEPMVIDDETPAENHPASVTHQQDETELLKTNEPGQAPAGNTVEENLSPSRRGSQESNMTTTTNGTTATTGTTTTGTSDTSSSSSSDSSSSDTVSSDDSDDDSTEEDTKSADTPLSESELESIYKTCIKNLEECVTRFPEHYKSIYRLVNIYLHAPERIRDLKRCKQLLLGTYTTGLGNHIQGLFFDRKQNNFFNGVWRIPSTEIDRPGSFAAHLSKCTIVLMEVLRLSADHKVLLELALQLHKVPDSDKRYIRDAERQELFQQALSFCTQSIRQSLKEHGVDRRNDGELILLLLDIYKAHKKYIKYTALKECPFSILLSDTYRVYLEGKLGSAKLPEQLNATDYAIRFCQHEIGLRKNLAKNGGALPAPAQPESFLPAHILRAIMNPVVVPAVSTVSASVVSAPVVVVTTVAQPMTASATVCNVAAVAVPLSVATSPVQIQAPAVSNSQVTVTMSVLNNTSERAPSPLVKVVSKIPAPLNQTTTTVNTPPSTHSTPRPRGRPPGSKNSTPSASSSSHANLMAHLPYGQMDQATMAALYGIYNNPSLVSSIAPQLNDPAILAFLTEYYKLTGMSSLLPNTNPLHNPSTSTFSHSNQSNKSGSPSKLPMFDINSLITSAAEKMIPTSPSTVVNIGSGQLTITPSAVSQSNPRPSGSGSGYKSSNQPSTSMFPDVPGFSMTQVKPKPQKSNILIPKDLPKSLSITPAPPIGQYPSTTSSSSKYPPLPNNMQYAPLQMHPDTVRPYSKTKSSAPKQQNRNKKLPKTQGTFPMHNQMSSLLTGHTAFAPIPSHSSSTPYNPTDSEFNQHIAAMSTYAELMKNNPNANASSLLAQFEKYAPLGKKATAKSKVKQQPHQHAQMQLIQQQQKPLPSTIPSSQKSPVGRLSVKQLQTMQHQQPSPNANLMPNPYAQKASSSSSTNQFSMLTSPFGHQMNNTIGGTSVTAAPRPSSSSSSTHSPLRSPQINLPSPSPVLPQSSSSSSAAAAAGGHGSQISPSKTLQQILAERQRVLSDANIKQQQQILQQQQLLLQQQQQHIAQPLQRSDSMGSVSSSKSTRKSDNVIILD